jgi:TRAP-type C4-dicarboxylate transport system substrate-binding protein
MIPDHYVWEDIMKANLWVAGFAAAAMTSIIPVAAMAKTRLVVNCFWSPQHFVCADVLPGWLAEVEKVTEGRVVGNIPPKSVAPPPEQLNSVEKGVVDAAVQFNGLIGNRVNGALTAMQPFSGNGSAVALTQAAWETNQKFYPNEFDSVELLSQWVITSGNLFSDTDTPIVTLDDFKSRKIWALPGPLANIAKELGAGVVSTPAVQSNEVISNGVVDSHIGLNGEGLTSFQVLPYTKSMTRFSSSIYRTTFSFFINKDKWAEISPEDQAAIRALSQETIGATAADLWEKADDVYDTFEANGIKVVDADPALEAAMVERSAVVIDAWKEKSKAAGIDADAALAFYLQRATELSK